MAPSIPTKNKYTDPRKKLAELIRGKVPDYETAANPAEAADNDRLLVGSGVLSENELLAFYAEVSREPDFDVRVAPCWVRQWIPRMISLWFLPSNLDRIERSRRVETLQQMFPDGFDSFDSLMKYADLTKRTMGWFLRLFVRHPSCRWASELFFRVYYALCEMRGKKRKSFRTQVCAAPAKP